MDEHPITFSFGENWQDFLRGMSPDALELAIRDTREWIDDSRIHGKAVLDAGCGSGLHSLSFLLRGAGSITSFDLDPRSVAATRSLWEKAGKPPHWRILQGSLLDEAFLSPLAPERFDVVYCWGVAHHTGGMWKALANIYGLARPGGMVWISLYAKGGRYQHDLAMKQRYNAATRLGRWLMERRYIARLMRERLRAGQNPFAWNRRKERGMDTWHDIVDWLGGLPYEVASVDEVLQFAIARGGSLIKVQTAGEGACQIYLIAAGRPG